VALINRNPAGALELMNLNLQGEFPRFLVDSVQSVIDVTPFFYQGIGVSTRQQSGAILVIGGAESVTVPAGEIWAIRAVSGRALMNEAAQMSYHFSIQWVLPGNVQVGLAAAFGTIFPGQFAEVVGAYEVPLLLSAGHTLSFRLNQLSAITGLGIDVTLNVAYHRLSLA